MSMVEPHIPLSNLKQTHSAKSINSQQIIVLLLLPLLLIVLVALTLSSQLLFINSSSMDPASDDTVMLGYFMHRFSQHSVKTKELHATTRDQSKITPHREESNKKFVFNCSLRRDTKFAVNPTEGPSYFIDEVH